MILKTVLRTLKHYKLLSANQTLIIGVSGGTDSLALLHILNELRQSSEWEIHVATLNHGLRGSSGEADLQFVKRTAQQWGIPYTVGEADVPQLAQDLSIGIEEAARKARYDFLANVADQQQSTVVMVAHHADDQMETMLMHIIRGSGLSGLQGMQVVSNMPEHPDISLVRPLLQITRIELEQYCAQHDLVPRHDETNDDTHYQRNFIRHQIVPQFKQLNPDIVSTFSRLSEAVTFDEDYINTQLDQIIDQYVSYGTTYWQMSIDIFLRMHESLQRRYLMRAFHVLARYKNSLTNQHILSALSLIRDSGVGAILDLPDKLRLRLGYQVFFIESTDRSLIEDDRRLIPDETHIVLSAPSHWGQSDIHVDLVKYLPENYAGKVMIVPDDMTITLRTRRAGDRFKPIGMKGHSKKVKDWMIDRKIPKEIRNRIPLVVMNGEVIAIYHQQEWHLADLSQYNVNANRQNYLILD